MCWKSLLNLRYCRRFYDIVVDLRRRWIPSQNRNTLGKDSNFAFLGPLLLFWLLRSQPPTFAMWTGNSRVEKIGHASKLGLNRLCWLPLSHLIRACVASKIEESTEKNKSHREFLRAVISVLPCFSTELTAYLTLEKPNKYKQSNYCNLMYLVPNRTLMYMYGQHIHYSMIGKVPLLAFVVTKSLYSLLILHIEAHH